jgi:hypothetical protein
MNMTPSRNWTRIAAAGVDHFLQIIEGDGAGFFAEDVFAGGGSAEHPFFSEAGGQGNVDGVYVAGKQGLIVSVGVRGCLQGGVGLTFGDETLAFFEVAAGDGGEDGVAA